LAEEFEEFFDHWFEQGAAPAEVAKQAGPTDGQAKEVVQEVLGLAQGNAEMGAAVTGQQAGARPDVRTRQFQIATPLAAFLATATTIDEPAIAMPLGVKGDVMRMISGALLIVAAAIVFSSFFVVRCLAVGGSSLIGPHFNLAEFYSTMTIAMGALGLSGLGLLISGFFERASSGPRSPA